MESLKYAFTDVADLRHLPLVGLRSQPSVLTGIAQRDMTDAGSDQGTGSPPQQSRISATASSSRSEQTPPLTPPAAWPGIEHVAVMRPAACIRPKAASGSYGNGYLEYG